MNITKEELIEHAREFGYTREAINKISGFLIGVGLKEEDEVIIWKIGEGTWEDFYAWFIRCPHIHCPNILIKLEYETFR